MIDPAQRRFMAQRVGATTIEFDDASHAGGYSHYFALHQAHFNGRGSDTALNRMGVSTCPGSQIRSLPNAPNVIRSCTIEYRSWMSGFVSTRSHVDQICIRDGLGTAHSALGTPPFRAREVENG